MNKEEAVEYSKGWHAAMENISYTAENYLPGVDPETGLLNGSVRTYGTWTGTNTQTLDLNFHNIHLQNDFHRQLNLT